MTHTADIDVQDLSGFDDNIKAVHGTPPKRAVTFGHSVSMPVPGNPGNGQTPSRRVTYCIPLHSVSLHCTSYI